MGKHDDWVRSLVDPRLMDPHGELVMSGHLSADELNEVVAVLEAMSAWSGLEREMSEKAREYMRLGETDMRALRYLIAAQRQGILATPGMIASHLRISPAATTKLTDRLEAGGHIRRLPHPADRRRIAIEGMGSRYPIADNNTNEGRARNRRVEIFVGELPRR